MRSPTIGGAVVALHGVTNKIWSYAHTFFLGLAIFVKVASLQTA